MSNFRVVLSSNEDPKYLEFWPIVSRAWKQLFDVKASLAFLTNRDYDDPFISELEKHGEVVIFEPVADIPQPNLAKVLRHILASYYTEEICLINDMDLLPLQRGYIDFFFKFVSEETLVTMGFDLYHGLEKGKFPIGNMMAYGKTFHKIVNPHGLSYPHLVTSWIGLKVFDHKEDISRTVHHENPDCFSDESLFRALISKCEVPVLQFPISFERCETIDRSAWNYDPAKLNAGYYVESHLLRPYSQHKEKIQPLIDYLNAVAPYSI